MLLVRTKGRGWRGAGETGQRVEYGGSGDGERRDGEATLLGGNVA